ncbi:MAG: FixH family protein [Rhodothermales bacterium]
MPKSPNVLWPAAIVGLLLLGGVTTFAVLIASRSDGGAQVVDNYYRKSVAWDSVAAERRASEALGWVARIEIQPPDQATGVAVITDKNGEPLTGLQGAVTVSRPQSSVTYGTHSLVEGDSSSGRYSFSFPYRDHGLWDLEIVARRAAERFIDKIRIEI